jgi:tripartite-type tricarboxylate transporter receptor subunit TctC
MGKSVHCTAAAVAIFVAAMSAAWPQSARVTKIIVPFAPGGGVDVVARVVAQGVGDLQGPTMVVENRPGGGTVLAAQDVLRSTPDGSALLFINNSVVVAPQLKKLDYDPLSDLTAVCKIASTPTVIVVGAQSPYLSLSDLIGAARAKPGALNFGAVPGAVLQIGFEMFQRAANIRMALVPYNGTIPEITAILGGQIDAALVDYPAAAGQLQAAKVRALAIGSPQRADFLPNVPTIAESGIKDYQLDLWYGTFVPAKTPPEQVAQLASWLAKALQVPGTRSKLAAQGVNPVGQCGAPFGAFVRKEYDTYGRVIREANIKVE